jgi:hypothetical protein
MDLKRKRENVVNNQPDVPKKLRNEPEPLTQPLLTFFKTI